MPYSTYSDYTDARLRKSERAGVTKISISTSLGHVSSLWTIGQNAGATPSTPATCLRTTAGAISQAPDQRLVHVELTQANAGTLILCDRLSHQGGLDATVTSAQTTNLPTAALPRHTSGDDVWMAAEIYTTVGTTAANLTVSYTNQAGTTGRTSPTVQFGGSNYNAARRVMLLPFEGADSGVRSVENVTLSASTGTAGNFGITLFKPLLWLPYNDAPNLAVYDAIGNRFAHMPATEDYCLFWLLVAFTSTSGILQSSVTFIPE